VLVALALLVFGARLLARRTSLPRLPLDGPIAAFVVWTLLSAAFSSDPLWSHESSKKLVLFLLLYLAVDSAAFWEHRERLVDCLLLGGLALAGEALLQYYFLGYDGLHSRPRSFLGHYMTASGLAMCTALLAACRLVFGASRPVWPTRADLRAPLALALALGGYGVLQAAQVAPLVAERVFVAGLALAAGALAVSRGRWHGPASASILAMLALFFSTWALLVSRTRSAWLGLALGALTVATLRAPRTAALVPLGIVGLLALRPAPVIERLTVTDDSSRDRYYMWQAGLDMIVDKPVFGQGPGMIKYTYAQYRWPQAPGPNAHHLHNNMVQLAAERGLPCLVWWLWLMAAALGGAWREMRRAALPGNVPSPSRWVAAATLSILAAILTAGMFEYNFGDSEVLMFALFVIAQPFALRRERARLRG
jgi:O-antigen ligase